MSRQMTDSDLHPVASLRLNLDVRLLPQHSRRSEVSQVSAASGWKAGLSTDSIFRNTQGEKAALS